MVWIEAVDNPSLSEYVSKQIQVARYVGKENLKEAYKEKKGHRTLWRSEGLKAKFELETETEWSIIKEGVFVDETVRPYFQKLLGVDSDGQKKQTGQDLEETCGSISTESTAASIQDVEAQERPNQHGQSTEAPKPEGINQQTNQS